MNEGRGFGVGHEGGGPRTAVVAVLLVVAVGVIFGQLLGSGFINYDDPQFVTHNPHVQAGLTLSF